MTKGVETGPRGTLIRDEGVDFYDRLTVISEVDFFFPISYWIEPSWCIGTFIEFHAWAHSRVKLEFEFGYRVFRRVQCLGTSMLKQASPKKGRLI